VPGPGAFEFPPKNKPETDLRGFSRSFIQIESISLGGMMELKRSLSERKKENLALKIE
jgi:hypothetical protein